MGTTVAPYLPAYHLGAVARGTVAGRAAVDPRDPHTWFIAAAACPALSSFFVLAASGVLFVFWLPSAAAAAAAGREEQEEGVTASRGQWELEKWLDLKLGGEGSCVHVGSGVVAVGGASIDR